MKLKTLKDIDNANLRQEVIKQINFFRKNQGITDVGQTEFCGHCFTNETEDWVKWFFNITKEELK